MQSFRSSLLPTLAAVALLLTACGSAAAPSVATPVLRATPVATQVVPPTPVPTALQQAPSTSPTPSQSPIPAPTATPSFEVVRDIAYAEPAEHQGVDYHLLDVYVPAGKADFPVLVWFHGGALKYETKNEHYASKVAARLASEGIGVVLPSYRLSPNVKYPGYIEDAASAVAWVYENISKYQGNSDKLLVGGHSSGAYLAAMLAMDKRYLKAHGLSPEQLAGLIAMSGEMLGDYTVWGERGVGWTDKTLDPIAPIFYVRRDTPPILCMCAEFDSDPPTMCEENEKFVAALQATGNQNATFQQFAGRTHFSMADMQQPDDTR